MYTRAYKSAVSIPPLLWVTVFLLIPYAILSRYSFWQVSPLQIIIHTWSLENYRELPTKSHLSRSPLPLHAHSSRSNRVSVSPGLPASLFPPFY